MIAYVDGEFVADNERAIAVSDRGFLFGEGDFTTIRVHHGFVEFFDAHVRRLENNCRELGIKPPKISFEEASALITRNHAVEGCWRLKIIVTGGQSPSDEGGGRAHGHLVMVIEEYCQPQESVSLGVCSFSIASPLAHIKSLSYLDRLWIKAKMENFGVDDLIVTTSGGIMLETTFSNIFWVKDECLFTPATTLPLLPGIALTSILGVADSLEFNIREVESRIKDIPSDASVCLCNSLTGIRPVRTIEGKKFPLENPLVERLTTEYQQMVCQHSLHY